MRIYYKKAMNLIMKKLKVIFLFPWCTIKFISDLLKYKKMGNNGKFKLKISQLIPFLTDRIANAGLVDRHYFLQDIYVAQAILKNQPLKHYDIGSRIDGFISHLLVFLKDIVLIDIRPLPNKIENLTFICSDATDLQNIEADSIESLSSLHAVEHFGLGRYGDSIDPNGCFKAMKSMQRVVRGGGYLYFSVPISNADKLLFNSHRVFNPITVIETFNELTLIKFSYVSVRDEKIYTLELEELKTKLKKDNAFFSDYDCGIFEFIKNK